MGTKGKVRLCKKGGGWTHNEPDDGVLCDLPVLEGAQDVHVRVCEDDTRFSRVLDRVPRLAALPRYPPDSTGEVLALNTREREGRSGDF